MPLSTTIANAILNRLHAQAGTSESPANLHVGLWIGSPGNDGQGGAEIAGGGYARVLFNDWSVAANRRITNSSTVTFPGATAKWGAPTHVALWSSLTSMLAADFVGYGDLNPLPGCIGAGSQPEFDPGKLIITL